MAIKIDYTDVLKKRQEASLLHSLTKFIRERFHPLFALRKSKIFVDWIMPAFDVPVACNLWRVKWKVYLRLARNLSLVLNSKIGEPGTGALFLALSKLIRPKIFWDVGANIGGYSWLLMSVNEDLQAILFEPDPDNASLVEKTISKSHLKNARLFRCAVSDKTGNAAFALDKASGATGSLITEDTFNQRLYGHKPVCITVETITLDDIWKNEQLSPPDLIKIDVEMAEHLVFQGAIEVIKHCQPVIIFETCSSNKANLLTLLLSSGYMVIGADYPYQSTESAVNLLALPARYSTISEELSRLWSNEYESWEKAPAK